MIGIVTSDSTKGYCFCETVETCQSLFIHISQVKDGRCLHAGDHISLDVIPNPNRPGQYMGGNVVYLGHKLARQTNGGVK
jgi:cold shock CspA family protein